MSSPGSIKDDIAAIQRIDAVPRILEVVCRTTGIGFAAVARVTDERWVCCAVRDEIRFGLEPGGELRVETTICSEIRDSRQTVVIDEVARDEVFCRHPTPARYGFQSYISVPIILADGRFFGTLCALDPRPLRLKTPQTVGMFELFAELIGAHLDAADRLAASEAGLLSERQTAELREHFIAVLGHDLRNPLAAIDAALKLLPKAKSRERAAELLAHAQTSVSRMSALIDNVMDLARGRLGGGIPVERRMQRVEPVLSQVVAELQATHPERAIEAAFDIRDMAAIDAMRMAQLFSNLLANALVHGSGAAPVRVEAATAGGELRLSVSNAGEPIPEAALGQLFRPFYRLDPQRSGGGLGLGLYIASEIARAHGGAIDVASSCDETRFTFRMRLR